MNTPKVSIIIPVFNRPKLVSDTIESVLLQTYYNWELIIVDDQSTDNTLEVLRSYERKDSRIKVLLRDREPKGAPTCRNIGASVSRGEYLIFWDSDDLMTPWCLFERVNFMDTMKNIDFGLFQLFDLDYGNNQIFLRYDLVKNDYLKEFLTFGAAWGTPAVIWRRKSYMELSSWDERALSWQDGELHIRAIVKGLKHQWGKNIPDGIIRSNLVTETITLKLDPVIRLKNRLEISKSLITELDSSYRDIFIRATKARLWFEIYNWSTSNILLIAEKSRVLGFLTIHEEKRLVNTYKFYQFFRALPFIRGLYYRMFIKKNISSYVFFPKQPLDSITLEKFKRKFNVLSRDVQSRFIELIGVQSLLFD